MATVDYTATFPNFIVPPAAVTLDGFRAWVRSDSYPEYGHITFVNGRLIIDMSPERYESHLKLKGAIYLVLGAIVAAEDLGEFYPDGGFFTHDSAGVSNEPDAMFASWKTLESGTLKPPTDLPQDGKHKELVGTPDWVCEVVSDSSVGKDAQVLRQAYHAAGIPEYWLVDARGEAIDFQLLVWQADGYLAAADENGWLQSPVFERQFQLTRERNRVGNWRYDLKHRSALRVDAASS